MGRKKRILHPTSARKQNYYAELTFGKGGEAAGSERRATIFGVFFFCGEVTRTRGVVVPLKLEGVLGTMTSLEEKNGEAVRDA